MSEAKVTTRGMGFIGTKSTPIIIDMKEFSFRTHIFLG